MDFKNQIIEKLKSNRPSLSASSLKTYLSLLSNLPKKINVPNDIESFDLYKVDIVDFINTLDKNSQGAKTLLSALYIITMDEDYRTSMMDASKIITDNYINQKKTNKQNEMKLTFNDIKNKYEKLLKIVKADPSVLNYQNVLLVGLMSGIFEEVVPRRNEWANVKYANYNENLDNYIKNNIVTFNTFKSKKWIGKQTVKLPIKLMNILKQYMKVNTNDTFLFYNNKGNCLCSSELTKRLHQIFGGQNMSCDHFRSIYISEKYKNLPTTTKDMISTAHKMGHSVETALTCYLKPIDNNFDDIYDCTDKYEMPDF